MISPVAQLDCCLVTSVGFISVQSTHGPTSIHYAIFYLLMHVMRYSGYFFTVQK